MNKIFLGIGLVVTFTSIIFILIFLKKINTASFRFFEFSDASLSKQHLFKLAIFGPFFLAIIFCFPLWIDSRITINFSSGGYEKFLSLFKLPLGIWSLSIPLVAIVAHIHRTIQTASQIEATKKKNLIDGFFSHHKFFTEAVSKLPSHSINYNDLLYTKKIESPFSLYHTIFPTSSLVLGFNPEGLDKYVNILTTILQNLSDRIKNIHKKQDNHHERLVLLSDISEQIKTIDSLLHIPTLRKEENYLYMGEINDSLYSICIPHPNESTLKEDLEATLDLLKRVLELSNIELTIEDPLYFYAYSKHNRNFYFEDFFSEMAKMKRPTGVGIATEYKKGSETYTLYRQYLSSIGKY